MELRDRHSQLGFQMVQYSIFNEAYLGKATTSLNENVSLLILTHIILGELKSFVQ